MTGPGLYLHIPFCRCKCSYCAFNSVAGRRSTVDTYLDLLARQIKEYAALEWCSNRRFTTLFIGGGTPSLASPAKLAAIIRLCRSCFTLADQAEISMEANPDTISPELLTTLRQAGLNRLSIGIQSFNNTILAGINRAHTAEQAIKAFHLARRSGLANINIDLIYGLPGQTMADWQKDLQQIPALNPEHLALYELTIEPESPLGRLQAAKALTMPNEDLLADMEEATHALLSPHYQRYEISSFCRPGRQCRHNLNYWQNGSYLGLGAGAVSCLDGLRFTHEPDPHRFMSAIEYNTTTIRQAECLSRTARFRETMIMGLRLIDGFNLRKLEKRLRISAGEVYGPLLAELSSQGRLIRQGEMIRLAPGWLPVANQVLGKLV